MANETEPTSVWPRALSPFIVVALVVPLVLLKAWVLTWLWTWYVVPMFGVPPLRLVFAFGLSLTANYLLPHSENEKRTGGVVIAQMIFSPLVALALGWIGTWFI